MAEQSIEKQGQELIRTAGPGVGRWGRLVVLLGDEALPRAMSLTAVSLAGGEAVLLLDGGNRFDAYPIARAARRWRMPPEDLLRRLFVSRAFTCHQMSALVRESLRPEIERRGARKAIILSLLHTFLDEDVPEREACTLLQGAVESLRRIAREGYDVLLTEPSLRQPVLRMKVLLPILGRTILLRSGPVPTVDQEGRRRISARR